MIQKPTSSSQYQADILAALQQTGVRQTAPGGKARALADIIGDRLGVSESRALSGAAQALVPYATGDSLDFLGEIWGIPRIGSQDNAAAAVDGNFTFYVQRGTFANINNGQDITIPAGTQISTAGGLQTYITSLAVTLPAASASVSFSADSAASGASGNATAGVFTRHNFTNYADSRFGSLLVTNNFGLVEGRDEEDDDSYRYRIALKLQSRDVPNAPNVRLAVLGVPGVQDVVFERAAGTFYCYVYGISPSVPPSLLQMVQSALDQAVAWPNTGTAITPDLVGISLNDTVTFISNTSAADQQLAIAAASSAAQDYLNNLAIGDAVVLNEIADRIRNADARILDIGDPDKPLQEIFLWRSRADGTRYSRFLVANYTPALGERVVVESSIANPINLIPA